GESGLLDPTEGSVELLVVDQEGVVLGAHVLGIDEVERDAVAGLHRPEGTPLRPGLDPQDVGKEFCRSVLVLGRNDDVIEGWHEALLMAALVDGRGAREFNRAAAKRRIAYSAGVC